jgi:hypothetical protein
MSNADEVTSMPAPVHDGIVITLLLVPISLYGIYTGVALIRSEKYREYIVDLMNTPRRIARDRIVTLDTVTDLRWTMGIGVAAGGILTLIAVAWSWLRLVLFGN